MKKALLTLSLSLATLPVYADALTPTTPGKGSVDLPPAREAAPVPSPAPATAVPAPAPAPVAAPAPAPQPVAAPAPVPTPVAAPARGWYGNINAGGGWVNLDTSGTNASGDDDDSGLGFLGFSIGRSIGNNLRLEAEFTGRNSSDFATATGYASSAQTNSAMLNLLYDLPINSQWSAFVGAGLGAAFVDLETSSTSPVVGSSTDANFAWQGIVGAAYALDKANSLNFGYRYVDAGSTEITSGAGNFKGDLTYHDIFIGLKHLF